MADTLHKVHERRQTIAQAAKNLRLRQRQIKRLSKRLKNVVVEAMASRKVEKSGNHQLPASLFCALNKTQKKSIKEIKKQS